MNDDRQSLLDRTATGLRTSPLLRLITMGALTVVLLIPIDWISSLIHERMNRRAEAIAEVSSKWGRAQTVWGPFLTVPYEQFGVDFVTPVDAHRMSERSVKYAHLFLMLTFASIWLIEVLSGQRVHPIQYLLVGCALCTFYLLELSLSEQIGFSPAYLLAAVAIVALLGLYAVAVLHGAQRAAIVSGTVSALYGYLFVVLTNEDYALLLGSLALFAALAVIMLTTRRIDWYAPLKASEPASELT